MENTSDTTREFTLRFLQDITNNFSKEHVIGSGGYGIVYRGVLENGEEIAIKKLHFMPGLDDTQFRNEFNNLMRVQHKNITRLVGYCYHLGHERIMYNGEYVFAHVEERVFCFEYLQHGTLDKYISDESCGLDWRTRYKIIKGVCEGLNYLHNGYKSPIYHMDLKPANILLDKDMTPKIGDFGLSRLFPSAHTYTTIKIIGTPGYMPPEYIDKYEITSKFDVFSLGAIIIRIMAGDEGYSKHANMNSQEFVEHVHENWRKRMREIMTSHTSLEVMTCIEIALRCVEADRVRRPTISEIVIELNEIYTVESSPISQWLGAEDMEDSHGFEYSDDEPIVAPPCSETRVQLVIKKYGNKGPLCEHNKKVMLQLTRAGSVSRLGLYMVVVLDISGSMQGKKIQEMKTTMKFIIDKLSPIDRLSIVTFSATASRICPLRLITETSLPELQGLIDSLTASGDAANIIDGLQTGFKVLANRKVSRGRVVAVMIMSDGLQISRGSQVDVDGNDVPVYTFGFGADHDPMVLHEIADKSNGGTFSVVMQDMESLSLAFSRCLDSLLTVVVQDLRLTVESVEKESMIPIKVITDGSHPQTQEANHGSVTISLGNLSSREVRKVTVDLLLLAIGSERSKDILKITYSYSTFGELFVAPPLMITVWRTNTSMVVPEKEKPSLDRDMQNDHGFEYSDDEPIVGPPCSVKLMIKKYGNEAPLYENNKEVMVQLTGGGYVGRLGLDIVVILDVSGSMQGKKIQGMKTTMKFIIDKLGPIDRLSVVTFSAAAARLCPLRLITETSQSELQGLIDGLTASGDTANIIEGLQTGIKVLADRKVSRSRFVAVMIMSDGLQINRGSQIDIDCNDVPIYTFGFGADHDPTVLHQVAYKSNGGTFSAVIPDMDSLSLPFSQCLDNLLNIVVQDLRLMVESVEKECNVPIKVITDGSYPQAKESSLGSATVSLRDFYGRKVLNITVSILLPTIKSKHSKEIFKITYSYSTVEELFVAPPSTLALWSTSTGMAILEKENPPAVPTAETQVHQMVKKMWTEATTSSYDLSSSHPERPPASAQADYDFVPTEETQVHQMVKKTWTAATTSSYDLSYCHPERPSARAQAGYDFLFRLVVIGNSGVGKSIIVSQFVDGSFSTSFISTAGVDFKIRTVELDGRRIKLQIWDTAGHERYRALTEGIIKWNKEIEEYATDANKILVGNRIDMAESRRTVPTSRGQALADEYGIKFFETSAKTNLNVEQAFFSLVRDIMRRLSPPETDSIPVDPTIKVETSQRRHRNLLAYARELLSKKK